ncbi:hypothetical protein GW17_00016890 [Ensete ventricosum]|nr:hypothetical protein GW17_00016890 [Ensete ventricosum]
MAFGENRATNYVRIQGALTLAFAAVGFAGTRGGAGDDSGGGGGADGEGRGLGAVPGEEAVGADQRGEAGPLRGGAYQGARPAAEARRRPDGGDQALDAALPVLLGVDNMACNPSP